jgi:DNA polymerase III delta prime subunit
MQPAELPWPFASDAELAIHPAHAITQSIDTDMQRCRVFVFRLLVTESLAESRRLLRRQLVLLSDAFQKG